MPDTLFPEPRRARPPPGAADAICDFADGFFLHITETPQGEAARTALGHVAKDLARLAVGPASLSNPVLAPGGPLLRVAGLGVDDDVLRTIPDRVVRRLGEAGITDAVVDSPEPGGHLDRLDGCACAVVLRLFPAPAGESGALPSSWIDIAAEWALGDLPPDRSEEHTSELQSLMRISYAVFCLKKK